MEKDIAEIKQLLGMQNTILCNLMMLLYQNGDVITGAEECLATINAFGKQVKKYNLTDVDDIKVIKE